MSSTNTNHTHNNYSGKTNHRLAVIHAMVGFGRAAASISLPIVSVMGVQACPVPISILSSHLAYKEVYRDDYTPHLEAYLQAWKKENFTFDGLYCGSLGSDAQITLIEGFLENFEPKVFLLDPMMGDNGKPYSASTAARCAGLRKLAAKATILTPNLTEACLLTDTPYQAHFSDEELANLCKKLEFLCPDGHIVITGIQDETTFRNVIVEKNGFQTYDIPRAGASRPGTGDIFASILAANALKNVPFYDSVRQAADFISLCIRESEAQNLPILEGVSFEQHLYALTNPVF
jgi:pyridoxine kinase